MPTRWCWVSDNWAAALVVALCPAMGRTASRSNRCASPWSIARPLAGGKRSACNIPRSVMSASRVSSTSISTRRPQARSTTCEPSSADDRPSWVVVAFEDESLALSSALFVHQSLGGRRGLGGRSHSHRRWSGRIVGAAGRRSTTRSQDCSAFPFLDRTCTRETIDGGLRDELAAAVHADYLSHTRGDADWGSGLKRPWTELDDDQRDLSRRRVDGIVADLASIDFTLAPLRRWGAPVVDLADDDVERLAEREHQRWRDDRAAAGWRHGAVRDDVTRRNPLLVPWAELPADAQAMNIDSTPRLAADARPGRLRACPRLTQDRACRWAAVARAELEPATTAVVCAWRRSSDRAARPSGRGPVGGHRACLVQRGQAFGDPAHRARAPRRGWRWRTGSLGRCRWRVPSRAARRCIASEPARSPSWRSRIARLPTHAAEPDLIADPAADRPPARRTAGRRRRDRRDPSTSSARSPIARCSPASSPSGAAGELEVLPHRLGLAGAAGAYSSSTALVSICTLCAAAPTTPAERAPARRSSIAAALLPWMRVHLPSVVEQRHQHHVQRRSTQHRLGLRVAARAPTTGRSMRCRRPPGSTARRSDRRWIVESRPPPVPPRCAPARDAARSPSSRRAMPSMPSAQDQRRPWRRPSARSAPPRRRAGRRRAIGPPRPPAEPARRARGPAAARR